MASKNDLQATEAQRQVDQIRLDDLKDQLERNKLGQFATPPALASAIMDVALEQLGRKEPVRFLEPSVGSGAFVSALFGEANARIDATVGIELDHAFADVASQLWGPRGLVVRNESYLQYVENGPAEAFNLLVANPPYVRHHHLDAGDKTTIARLLSSQQFSLSGLAGLYASFLLLSDRLLAPGAVSAWLIPSEFMDVNYGRAIKQYLTERVTLNRIHRFDPADVQFGDALVSSAVVIFTKAPPPEGATANFTYGGPLDQPTATQLVPIVELSGVRKWTRLPAEPIGTVSDDGPTLGDLFKIQRGIATGANKLFILEKERADEFGLPAEYLKPILPSPRNIQAERLDADRDGHPLIDKQLVVIDCDLPPEQLADRHPALWAYLSAAVEQGVHEKYLPSRRKPWYKQEQRKAPMFFCTYMGRGVDLDKPFRLIWNCSQAIATNMYLMLYPHKELQTLLDTDLDLERRLAAALANVSGEDMRNSGRVYGGGLHKIEPSELAQLPISELADVVEQVKDAGQLRLAV